MTVTTLEGKRARLVCQACGFSSTTRRVQAESLVRKHDCARRQQDREWMQARRQRTCDRCGFTTKAGQTKTGADARFKHHGCDRRIQEQERHDRYVAAIQANTKVVDCQHAVRRPHGTKHGYDRDGCRCPDCRAGARAYEAEFRKREAQAQWGGRMVGMVDSTGTVRRLQALGANGWSHRDIARALGHAHPASIADFKSAGMVHADTHYAVKALYDRVQLQPGPSRYRERVARYARKHGWLSCWAWDEDTIDDPAAQPNLTGTPGEQMIDEVVVELLMAGERVPHAHRAEVREAVNRLTRAGKSSREIADIMGRSERSVTRDRHALRVTEPVDEAA